MRGRSRTVWIAATLVIAAFGYAISWESPPPPRSRTAPIRRILHQPPDACARDRTLAPPSDDPVRLTCAQAKAIAAQARENLAQPPGRIDRESFATTTLDWLDPHGLWSVAPDAPVGAVLRRRSSELLAALDDPTDEHGCAAAVTIGSTLRTWVDELRDVFDHQSSIGDREPWSTAREAVFEDGVVQRPARELAADIGKHAHSLQSNLGRPGERTLTALRRRVFPQLSEQQWGQTVLAAALRAYVISIDAHGAWAPMDEETSLFEVELDGTGRRHLWGTMTRTIGGVRIDEHPIAPLATGDVLLSIAGVATAGLSVEQIEQLGILDPTDPQPAREVEVLREGTREPQTFAVAPLPSTAVASDPAYAAVRIERVPYRQGHVAVLTVLDVPDDLGVEMLSALAEARLEDSLVGVVLDLRGNGGGSIDGAKEALAPFLSGAPLFPMRRRDGSIEIELAPVVAETDRFNGPLATMVDGDTASAAEMIAGALASYGRAEVVGVRTFGKGCAQEYLDDEAGGGVLRLSTLVYALPDGRPVQRVGLQPTIRLDYGTRSQREDTLPNAMAPWRGPDIRRQSMIRSVAWPPHAGHVGPCRDENVCKALRAVGSQRGVSARSGSNPAVAIR